MKYKSILPALAWLLSCIPPLVAAEAEKPFPFTVERTLNIVCLAADSGISSVWMRTIARPEGGGEPGIMVKSTAVPFSKRSEPIRYAGPAKIEFFDEEPPPGAPFDEEGIRRGPKPFAVTTLPTNQREVLLLFVPLPADAGDDGLKYRLLPFDDSKDMLPWGSYRLINFTNRPFVAFAGSQTQRHELAANRASGTIAPGGAKRNLQWIIFDAAKTDGKPVFSAQWLHRPDHRSLVFITESRNQRGAINVKTIGDWKD